MQPDFNRVRTALLCGQPDKIPLAEVGIEKNIKENFLGKRINDLNDEVQFWVKAGYDYVLLGRDLVISLFPGIYRGMPYKPRKMIRNGKPNKGLITNIDEFYEYPWPNPEKADYSEFETIDKYLPKGMKVIAALGPIFQWTLMLMGYESFCYATIESRELVDKIFCKVGEIRYNIFKNILSKCDELGAIWMQDDLAFDLGLMVRPEIYREYLFPWLGEIGYICKCKNLPFIFHTDGTYWELIDDLIKVGVNAIHPIEPKGMGKDINRLKKDFSNKLCLIGGVDLDVLIRGNNQSVEKETLQRIKEIAPGGGYLLGSSNTISSEVRIDNYRVMIDTALKYGKYPIKEQE